MARVLGIPEVQFGWRQAGITEVTLQLDKNEAEAVLRALESADWTGDKAASVDRNMHTQLTPTSLLASGSRVHMALAEWWKARGT